MNVVKQLGVAQFGSVLEWGSRGRRFESYHPDHLITDIVIQKTHRVKRWVFCCRPANRAYLAGRIFIICKPSDTLCHICLDIYPLQRPSSLVFHPFHPLQAPNPLLNNATTPMLTTEVWPSGCIFEQSEWENLGGKSQGGFNDGSTGNLCKNYVMLRGPLSREGYSINLCHEVMQ